jgi:hypothetical protein
VSTPALVWGGEGREVLARTAATAQRRLKRIPSCWRLGAPADERLEKELRGTSYAGEIYTAAIVSERARFWKQCRRRCWA